MFAARIYVGHMNRCHDHHHDHDHVTNRDRTNTKYSPRARPKVIDPVSQFGVRDLCAWFLILAKFGC